MHDFFKLKMIELPGNFIPYDILLYRTLSGLQIGRLEHKIDRFQNLYFVNFVISYFKQFLDID